MKKRRRKKSPIPNFLAVLSFLCAAIITAAGALSLFPYARPVLQNAAVAAVMTACPQGTMALLEQRFASQLYSGAEKEEPTPPLSEAESDLEPSSAPTAPSPPPEEPAPAPSSVPSSPAARPSPSLSIPEEYCGPVVEETMTAHVRPGVIPFGKGLIRNTTSCSDEEISSILATPSSLSLPNDGPQVLIVHTHATESFETFDASFYDTRHTWRSTNNEENMVAVGNAVAAAIEKWGIQVAHNTTQHDYPSYNGSYQRSEATIQQYLQQNPSIRVVLDIHRDAIQRESTLVKPIFWHQGQKAAQLMIISGCDDGTMDMPNWRENLRFAAGLQNEMETMYPGLTRPVFFCYRKYNAHLTTGSLLIEMGSHGNTLEEVLRTGQLAGDAIGRYLSTLPRE